MKYFLLFLATLIDIIPQVWTLTMKKKSQHIQFFFIGSNDMEVIRFYIMNWQAMEEHLLMLQKQQQDFEKAKSEEEHNGKN